MNIISIFFYFGIYVTLFVSTLLLYSFIDNRKILRSKELKKYPKVTVAVPAYNEEDTLERTVDSLLKLDYPKNKLQIIIVVNGPSTDNTLEVAKKYEKKGVEVYDLPYGGKGRALNYALKKAKGDFFGCLDADSFVAKDALKKIMSTFEDGVAAVTPAMKVYNYKGMLQRVQHMEYLLGVFLRKAFDLIDSIHITPGPFTFYRKSFFDRYGGYDEKNITEDIEVALRIQSKRLTIRNAIDAVVYTICPTTFIALTKQRLRWYLGFIENFLKYRKLIGFNYGVLGALILPNAIFSVFFSIVFLTVSLMMSFRGSSATFMSLKANDFKIIQMIKSLSFEWVNFIPDGKIIIIIPLVFFGLLMLIFAKYYSEDKSFASPSYVLYLLLYLPLFSFWWIYAVYYKLAGKKLRFGGVEWNNSIVTNVMKVIQ